ncbi:MAG: SpoIIE family protein phosphatase [Bacteroidales bacterium]|nr:SpoIIE family protein phosphatase [Bacteroidales bacterium]
MKLAKLITAILLLGILSLEARGQEEQLLFHTIDEQNGLMSDQINCMELDDFGYLWVGCPVGLSRYDGKYFKLYSSSPENRTNIVTGNSILNIQKDPDGNMWFASEKGVSRFDIISSKFSYYPVYIDEKNRSFYNYQIDRIYITDRNAKYAFSPMEHILKVNTSKNMMERQFTEYFKDHDPQYCYMDNASRFWLLNDAEHSITIMDTLGQVVDLIKYDEYGIDSPCKGSFAFYDNGDGDYWLGGDNGLIIWDSKARKFKELDAVNRHIYPTRETKCIFRDSRGYYWLSTNARETFYYNPYTKLITCVPHAKVRTPYKLNSPTVIDIKEDKRGLLWFGSWKGLSFTEINPNKEFHNISSDNVILSERNYVSAFDSRGDTIAIGCDGGGVTFWKKGSPIPLVHIDPAELDAKCETGSSLAVAFDKDGYCYNGGYNRAVTRIHPNMKDIDCYKLDTATPNHLQHDFTASILCDMHNNIWILSNGGGLCLLKDPDKGIFEYHNYDKNGDMHSGLCGTCLAEYDDHTMLVGSYIGFSVYDTRENIFTTYRSIAEDSSTLSHNWVFYFLVDSKKRIWVATGSGLNLFDIKTGKFRRFGRECGLLSDVVKGILEDENGLLWISTAKGISKFDPESGLVSRTYLASDGLLSENFQLRAAHKHSDGTMFFGMANGFTYFKPQEIRNDSIMPMPTITGMLINYNRVTPQDIESPLTKAPEAIDKIVLNSDQSTFTIEFISLNFVNESGNQYSYKLEGFNPGWVDIGLRHEVTFTNLDQGEYTFLVKCTNSDGITSDIRPLKIIVKPPFYRTWWFITISMLLIMALIGLISWMKHKSTRERQRQLEETVKERTEDLVKVNSALENQKEEIEKALNSTLILNDLSRQITTSFDVRNIIVTAHSHAKMMTKTDFFALGTYSQSKNSLEFNNIIYGFIDQEPTTLSLEANTLETECFRSSEDHYAFGENAAQSIFRNIEGEPFGTIFVLPIHEASHINGVLVIGCHQEDQYSKTDRANLRMITSYMSIALERAKDYHQLRQKNNAINGSIRYAKTIQDAILVHEAFLNRYFNAMIIFRPKDIVSGDFYWFKVIGNPQKPSMIFAADIDCTGHGVPGAFMSLISNILLNDIIIKNGIYEPNEILSSLHREIVQSLNQEQNLNDDGLDMSLCRFDLDENGQFTKVVYAGAKNSLFHYHADTGEIETHAADRISIGGFNNKDEKTFTNHEIAAHKGDMFYMSSDGIIDQNNKERKRFGRKRLIDTIKANHNLSMAEQKARLEEELDTFMDGEEQRDDISVMGLKIV